MKFCEAMERLRNGAKVTRNTWKDGLYFLMDKEGVKSFQPKLASFVYNEEIMVSDGWSVSGQENTYKFCEIIPFLQKGEKAMWKEWKEAFIYLDRTDKRLVMSSMEVFPFIPEFESFVAQDWVEIE